MIHRFFKSELEAYKTYLDDNNLHDSKLTYSLFEDELRYLDFGGYYFVYEVE